MQWVHERSEVRYRVMFLENVYIITYLYHYLHGGNTLDVVLTRCIKLLNIA